MATALATDDVVLRQIYRDLITGSHILHYHNVFDAYGHLSVRHPHHPDRFIMGRNIAPGTLSSERDLVEYYISNADPVDPNAPKGFAERSIHSEILKRFPGVNAVVHSHAPAVVPYTISGVPLRPCFHMAGFLTPSGCPVYDIGKYYEPTDVKDMLIHTNRLGSTLASYFSSSSSSNASTPAHPVVLMRGHGMTAIGQSIMEVVGRAVYTQENATIQTTALGTRVAALGLGMLSPASSLDLPVRQGGASSSASSEEPRRDSALLDSTHRVTEGDSERSSGGLHFLSEEESERATEMTQWSAARPWRLWAREVEEHGMYVNTI